MRVFLVVLVVCLSFAGCVNERVYFPPFDLFPSEGGDLPKNGRVIVSLDDVFGEPRDDASFSASIDGIDVPLSSAPFGTGPASGRVLVLSADLEPGPLVLTPSCEACAYASDLAYTVVDDEDLDPPVFESLATDARLGEFGRGFVVQLTPLPLSADSFVLRVIGSDFDVILLPQPSQDFRLTLDAPQSEQEEPRNECLDVRAIDAGGNETQLADPVCVTLPREPT